MREFPTRVYGVPEGNVAERARRLEVVIQGVEEGHVCEFVPGSDSVTRPA